MVNLRRGEIEARFDGKAYTLCLTLGALAELEAAFGDEDMLALATRFERGRLSAGDAQKIILAGLRGGGHEVSEVDVGRMRADGGAAGYVDAVARLLNATFGGEEVAQASGAGGGGLAGGETTAAGRTAAGGKAGGAGVSAGGSEPRPFPGTR